MIFETFFQDLRIGMRVLIKEKSFCALAVFVLAIGICAVATQFAVVNGVLLRAFTFRDAERLVDVQIVDPQNFTPTNFNSRITTADFADLRAQQKSFSDFTGYLNGSTVNITYNGQPKRRTGGYITYDFFSALGVSPVLGRNFLPEEDRPGADKAVLLSDALWRSDFDSDPNIVGKAVRVNGRTGVIVGVMAPKFNFPNNEELWIPVNAEFPVKPRNDLGINFISILARLKPGVSMEQASAEVSAIAKGFAAAYPDTNKEFTLGYVRPLINSFNGGGQVKGLLLTMLGFCVGVLLIACVNVMNMQFARATLRAKELAIRSSLGATRIRLIRQMLTESLLVASLGATVGIALAYWTTDYLNKLFAAMPNALPSWMTFDVDARVLVFVVGATMISAIISGLVPAWFSSRASAIDALKEGGRGNTSRAIGVITKGLVIFQIMVTCLLLIGAMLQLRSINQQQTISFGYDTSAILSGRMGLMEGDYPTPEKRQLLYDSLLRELRTTSQFESAALTSRFRMAFNPSGPFEIEGREYKADTDRTNAQVENISANYFDVLGVKLLEGRDFTDNDSDQKLPVAVINASLAKKIAGPGQGSALGHRIRSVQQNGTQPGPWRTVIGVIPDVRMQGPFNNNQQTDASGFYVPLYANTFGAVTPGPQAQQFTTVVVRPRGGQRADALAQALQTAVNRVDANLPLYFVGTPKVNIDSFLGPTRVTAIMFAAFGGVAVMLASVGLYGVMSFSVNQRRQEFGVRMALGADAARILRMVVRQGGWQLIIGLGLGLGITLAIAILARGPISNFLFNTSPLDPVTYAAVSALLAVVSLAAILIPARRATRVDPMVALRSE